VTLQLFEGDCLDILPTLEANSVDTIITDPPYGLSNEGSKGASDRFVSVLHKVAFPNFDEAQAQPLYKIDLYGVPVDGTQLSRGELAGIVEAWVGVPERPINLDNSIEGGEKEVGTGGVSTSLSVPDSVLSNERDTECGQFLGDYMLYLGNAGERAISDSLGSSMTQFFSGGFAMPISPICEPSCPSPLAALTMRLRVYGRKGVLMMDNTPGQADATPAIVAGAGAINAFMLRFNLGRGAIELLPTYRATKQDAGSFTDRPQLIRTNPATGSLPPKFKPVRVSVVGTGTNGADTLYFHLWLREDWHAKLDKSIPRGGFMGKAWDHGIPGEAFWREALRVAKPGAILMACGGTRTYHRLTCAIEDAGWEIRDCMMWLYGSGFPKSHDISKGIDRKRKDDLYPVTRYLAAKRDAVGKTNKDIDDHFDFHGMAGHWTSQASQPAVPTWEQWQELKTLLSFNGDMDAEVWRLNGRKGKPGDDWEKREVLAERTMIQGGGNSLMIRQGERREVEANITAPATPLARQWHGWGTALKPAYEPVIVAQKPLDNKPWIIELTPELLDEWEGGQGDCE
jgi:hypothetical protein